MLTEAVKSEAVVELDDEDLHELLDDCHALIAEVILRRQPKYITEQSRALLKRLGDVLGEVWVH